MPQIPGCRGSPSTPLLLGAKEDRAEEVTQWSHEASEGQSGDEGTGPGAPTSQPRARASAVPGEPASSPGWGGCSSDNSPHATGSGQSSGAPRGWLSHAHQPRVSTAPDVGGRIVLCGGLSYAL